MLNMPPVGAALSIMEFNMCVCLLFSFVCLCVYSLMLLCTHLSEFLTNKDVYIYYSFSSPMVLAQIWGLHPQRGHQIQGGVAIFDQYAAISRKR